MPLVIPRSGVVQYIRSEEVLAEILGHSDFDGNRWSIGDRIIFSDGTESRIRQEPGEQFYGWDHPAPASLEEVKERLGEASASSWVELFAGYEARSKRSAGCAPSAAVVILMICVAVATMAG